MYELAEDLSRDFEEGILATGGQVYCSVDGTPMIDLALGVDALGSKVESSTLFAVYCAGKPVVAVAVGCLVDDGELSWDDVVGDILDDLPRSSPICRLPIASLMNHTAGLHRLAAGTYLATPSQRRNALVASTRLPSGWRVGEDLAYGEVAAWHVLNQVIEALAGEDVHTFVRRRVLIPANAEAELYVGGMTADAYDANRERLGINIWIEGPSRYPMLMEATPRIRSVSNAAVGTSSSARGLGGFYEQLLQCMRSSEGMISRRTFDALMTRGRRAYDPVMKRECQYGLGFMVSLEDHHFGPAPSPNAFGHSGNGGMTAAFADPDVGLVAAYHLNGRTDAETLILYRRPTLVSRIYRQCVRN